MIWDMPVQARNFAADWAVERRGDEAGGDDEDGSFASSLVKSKRSKFTKTVRDEVSTSINGRNNLVFEGAPPLPTQGCIVLLRDLTCCPEDVFLLAGAAQPVCPVTAL
jgi:hypothetical protein